MSETARYLVTERSYIGLGVVEAGGEVEYSGEPGNALQPLNGAAKKAKDAVRDRPTNPTQYLLDANDLRGALKPVGKPQPAKLAVEGDPEGQGKIIDPGGSDPAMPFDPAVEGTDHTPVHLPKPAEDTETPDREERQTANQKRAAEAQAKANEVPKRKGEGDLT